MPISKYVFLAVLLLTGGCASRESFGLSDKEIDLIREINLAYPSSWEANDSARVDRLFTDDAVLIPHHGDTPREGIVEIRQNFWPPNSPPLTVLEYTMDIREIDGGSALAYSRGRFRLRFSFDGKEYSNEGNYMMVFRKQADNSWKISRFIWNDPVPQAR